MKKILLLCALILSILLAACSGDDKAVVDPTVAPPTKQAAQTTQAPSELTTADQDLLTANTWLWIGFTDPTQHYSVEDPESYSLAFQTDGTVSIQADCNNAIGSYTLDGSNIKIEIGPVSMAMCPTESRSEDFIKYLQSAAISFFEKGNLYIDLVADGGTMALAPTDLLMTDDGEGGVVGALWANPWQWVSFTNPVEQYDVDNPQDYVLTFNEDGTVIIVADCNNASGTYTVNGSSISVKVGPMTMAACSPESHSEDFIKYLGSAVIYFYEEGDMFIDLFADGGTMQFTVAEIPVPSLTTNPWQWVSLTNSMEQYAVDSPQNYKLTFFDDGSMNIVADCNSAIASYTTEGNTISIDVGAMTLAACLPESRSEQFVKYVGLPGLIYFKNGHLFIDLPADSGTLEFAPFEYIASPLTSNIWKWETYQSPAEQREVPNPAKYTLMLLDSSFTAVINADCNTILGTYRVDDQILKIDFGSSTLADCGTESLSDRFLSYFQTEVIYNLVEDGHLKLELPADGGTLLFGVYDPSVDPYIVATWDEALEKALAPQNCDAPGGVLLADTPQGRYIKAMGLASTQDQTPMQTTDRFQIGSNTKSFTTLLALLLQEDGLWSLDDPLSKWLPDQAAQIQNGDMITLRMLGQNHTGLPDYADIVIGKAFEAEELDVASLEKGYTPAELVDLGLSAKEAEFVPGEGWEYSTTNFILLGIGKVIIGHYFFY